MGVLATSGAMSLMYCRTFCCAGDRLGFTASCSSLLGGIPRSAFSMLPASGEFAYQLIQATTASGFLVLADADHSMLALYQVFRSVALPVMLGPRSISISSPPAALLTASS